MARTRSEATRQKVLDASLAVIAEVGVENFTIDAVTKQSGVAKTTIYRHFESANHVLLEAMDCNIAPFPTPNTGSLREDLITLYNSFLPIMEQPAMLRMMLGMLARSEQDESFRTAKNEFVRERHNPLRTVLELAAARGELPNALDIEVALDLVEGPFITKRLMRGEHITPELVEAYVDAVIYGLRGPRP